MKRALKVLLWVIIVAAVITLTQAATWHEIWELEVAFVTGFLASPFVWFETVALYKYAAVALAVLIFLIFTIVRIIKPKKREKKRKRFPKPTEIKKLNNETDSGIVMSGKAVTTNPNKFTRVEPKK